MKTSMMYNIIAALSIALIACSTNHRDNGWYPVDNSNIIEGEAIATTADFEVVSLDTVTTPGVAFIQGKLKQDKVDIWTDATERRIGKRIGFVFNDSVIMAPTVNCRIESGSFSINSSDKKLILEIYNSLDCEKKEMPDLISQKSYATANGMTMKIVSPDPITAPVDSIVLEFTNSREVEGMTGEWFRIDKKSPEGLWRELPYDRKHENADEELCVVFNAIGWIVRPDTPFQMSIKPWFYKSDWNPGTYRLVKTFSYPPYPIQKSDTAYVEFQII